MKLKFLFTFIVMIPVYSIAQNNNYHSLEKLSFLINTEWETIGKWNDGTPFEQLTKAKWGLNKSVIKIKMTGIVNMETNEKGIRNECIIHFNESENKCKMYTFDVFGGVTISTISFENNKIQFEYPYNNGEVQMELRDTWTKIDDNTYDIVVAARDNGKWDTILFEGKMKSKGD